MMSEAVIEKRKERKTNMKKPNDAFCPMRNGLRTAKRKVKEVTNDDRRDSASV